MFINSISAPVESIMKAHRTEADWKIISLLPEEWAKIAAERAFLTDLGQKARRRVEMLEELVGKEKLAKDEAYVKMKRDAMEMDKRNMKEYGRPLMLEEELNTEALLVCPSGKPSELAEMIPTINVFFIRTEDFLILINEGVISKCPEPDREKLLAVAHETLHYVYRKQDIWKGTEEIDEEAEKVVEDFIAKS